MESLVRWSIEELLYISCIGLASVVGVVVSTWLLRNFIAGGVCRSKTRLDGKTVIITGANTGIGLETAVDLAKRNARVILACRSVERGKKAAVEVRKRSSNDNVVFRQLDLASLGLQARFLKRSLKSTSSSTMLECYA